MDETRSDETEVFTAEKSMPETEKSEKVEPEKELGNGLSQLRDEESLETTDTDMEDLHDEAGQETLAKDQVEGNGLFWEYSLLNLFGRFHFDEMMFVITRCSRKFVCGTKW